MIKNYNQFFENDDGRKSMTRLLCFLSFWPASYIAVETKDAEIFAWYISAYVLGYVGGKVSDILNKPKQGESYVRTESSTSVELAKK